MADALLLVLASRSALAEGTRTLHRAGATGERGVMDVSDASSIRSLIKGGSSRLRGSFPQRVLAATPGP